MGVPAGTRHAHAPPCAGSPGRNSEPQPQGWAPRRCKECNCEVPEYHGTRCKKCMKRPMERTADTCKALDKENKVRRGPLAMVRCCEKCGSGKDLQETIVGLKGCPDWVLAPLTTIYQDRCVKTRVVEDNEGVKQWTKKRRL